MQTILRKMGNSTGMIVPKAMLKALGVDTGAPIELELDDGRIVVTPIRHAARQSWEADAEAIGTAALSEQEEDWLAIAHEDDESLQW